MVIMEPVQNAGGAFTPPEGYWQGVREICDRYGILLFADEVITGFGRLGAWFGSERYDIRPDLVTSREGPLLRLRVDRRRDRERRRHGALPREETAMYTHGITFGGHPVQAAIALKNIEIMKRERIVEHVAEQQDAFRETLAPLLDLPDRGRRARDGILLRPRARQGQGDPRDVLGRGVRDAPPRLPLAAPLRAPA